MKQNISLIFRVARISGLLALSILASVQASDWPQFRGPNSAAYLSQAQMPTAPQVEWTAELPGRGLSSPIIVGDKVFVTASSGPKQERLHVICFKTADGSKVWERELRATGRTMSHNKTCVAAPTPCSDGKNVYALWSSNDLAAFDLAGNLLWVRGLTVDYANASNSLGMSSSPIVVGETVVTVIENDSESYTLGIDARSGRNLWKLDRPKSANWSSPIVWQPDPSTPPVAVLQSKDGLMGVDPATGSRLWEYKDGASTMSSSVAGNGVIYAASKGITAIQPGTTGGDPAQLWRSEQMNAATGSPILMGDRVFVINSAGVLAVADAKTGERGWKLRLKGPFSGSPVGAGNLLAAIGEKGLLQIVDVTAPEGAVVGSLDLKDQLAEKELILCTPSLSGGKIFLRSDRKLWRVGG
ncbi:MAG TPA: PQQ-binding-like beta-propeller repeat protein [Verrucomicrobium sp.]|nr:PQQ-binding-like beta-propeller repeat protein [Verrucomicrobium sp.]